MGKILLPSLLSADFYQLKEELEAIEKAGITHLHLDVMDGHFVPNISFGPGVIKALRPHTNMFFDCHLMVEEPSFLYQDFKDAGVDLLTIQWEACRHIHRDIQAIKELGLKVGVSLNPATPVSLLEHIIEDIDLILIMTVNPGFGGQSFIGQMEEKIMETRRFVDQRNPDVLIEVDGGIKGDNIQEISSFGADWLVAGSAVFQRGKTLENAKALKALLDDDSRM